MNERILRFPSGAKIIFDSRSDNEGYTLYIWPEDLDELTTLEFTEEQYTHLMARLLEKKES